MQKSDSNKMAMSAHRRTKSSTTLNRRYVRRPAKNTDVMVSVKKSSRISHFNTPTQTTKKQMSVSTEKETVNVHPMQAMAHDKMRERQTMMMQRPQASQMSAKELKDQAIKKALMAASAMPETQQMVSSSQQTNVKAKTKKTKGMHFGLGRVVLAFSCAAAVVFSIVYFVNLNMPDISLKVAAMQTGINASYPSYVPRDYSVSGITSEDGKVALEFKNSNTNESFTLIEEVSSWDSQALMTNYVNNTFGENYSIVKEQGLTIYINGSNAAWVNGGIVYKLNADNGVLSNKQIRSIAVSL